MVFANKEVKIIKKEFNESFLDIEILKNGAWAKKFNRVENCEMVNLK